jgi:hypothetical protein
MTGKAYKRAVRGHMLVTGALSIILMRSIRPQEADDSRQVSPMNILDQNTLKKLILSPKHVSSLKNLFMEVLVRKVQIAGQVAQRQ